MASKRHDRRRRCLGKKRYDTARQAALDAAALSGCGRVLVVAYLCPHCDGIHVGHMPQRAASSPKLGPTAA